MKRSELFASVILLPIDWLLLMAGFVAAYGLRNSGFIFTPGLPTQLERVVRYGTSGEILALDSYLHYVVWIAPVMLAIFALMGLYQFRSSYPWMKRMIRVFVGVSVGIAGILLLFLLRDDFFIPRSTVLYAWFFCTAFVILGRLVVYLGQLGLRKLGIGVVHVAVAGSEDAQSSIAQDLRMSAQPFHEITARLDLGDVDLLLGELDESGHIDELIVVNEDYGVNDLAKIRNYCLEHHIAFSFVPALLADVPGSYVIRDELGVPAIEVRPTPLEGWGRIAKRLFDIVASLFLIILASPIYLVIAIWMKLSDNGPLIYKNERLGKGMEPIQVFKFRSMRIEYCDGPGYSGNDRLSQYLKENPEAKAEWDATSKLRNDPRVSTVGKVIRKTSLDELPQLFNVLQGSLSLVGPRPIVQTENNDEVAKYGEAAKILFTVKPGVTGLWQVSGRNDVSFRERIQLDLRYIENWSIWWDIKICFQTLSVFFPKSGKGGGY